MQIKKMDQSLKLQIIAAIKNFDINALELLLDEERPYMDVSKSLFLATLEKKFKEAKEDGCFSFDEVFFGVCGQCNKGCEGITFLSETGYYLDLYMEADNGVVKDIYVCHRLTNFIDLEKEYDLNFSFCKDEEVDFEPDSEYKIISQLYKSLLKDLEHLESYIRLDEFCNWFESYNLLKNFEVVTDPFLAWDYKLYNRVYNLMSGLDNIKAIKVKEYVVMDPLIDFQNAKTESEQLIWLFKNRNDRFITLSFTLPEDIRKNPKLSYKADDIDICINLSGYEHVIDYLRKLDNLYSHFLVKYKPLPEHFEQSSTGSIQYSLESYLSLHKKHLDIVKKYGGHRF